jgi:hypothetical protein
VAAHSIQSICFERFKDSTHPGPRRLCISQDVAALLRVDTRNTVPSYSQLPRRDRDEPTKAKATHSRLLDRRRAIGTAGSMMVSHVLTTSTSRMALRETFFRFDFEPSVATSLASKRSTIGVFIVV